MPPNDINVICALDGQTPVYLIGSGLVTGYRMLLENLI